MCIRDSGTAVLEEGMQFKPISFSAVESDYLNGRKLTREEVARSYHIPPPLVGILDRATFSNITEQHKMLYSDTLGPILKSFEQDIELQILSQMDDRDGVYVEFNIMEKLAGDFEQQTRSLQSAVGRPWMTPNEARSRMNLPRMEGGDADEIATPLYVGTTETGMRINPINEPDLNVNPVAEKLRKFFYRQIRSIGNKTDKFDEARWIRELSDDLRDIVGDNVDVFSFSRSLILEQQKRFTNDGAYNRTDVLLWYISQSGALAQKLLGDN